jgi:TonB family protein
MTASSVYLHPRIVSALFALLAVSGCALSGCATQAAKPAKPTYVEKAYVGTPRLLKVSQAMAPTPALATYLTKVQRRLDPHWNQGVRKLLDTWLPAGHPINTKGLVVEVAFGLDSFGQPRPARVLRSSGIPAFDNAALKVIRNVRKLPPLPTSLREREVTLRWHFFRHEPGCSASYARLGSKALPASRLMEWALMRKDWPRAAQILRSQGPATGVRYALASAGLATQDAALEDMALQLAPAFQLAGLLRERQTTVPRWNAALDALLRRKEKTQLLAVVRDYTGTTLIPLRVAERRERGRRLLALLQAVRRLGVAPPPGALNNALRGRDVDLACAAASLVSDRALLAKHLKRERRLRVRAAFAARLASAGHRGAVTILRGLLAGKPAQRQLALAALHGSSVEALVKDVGGLVVGDRQPVKLRIKAVGVLGSWRRGTRYLYRALRGTNSPVKLAAIAALIHCKSKLSASYRLADVAYKDPKHAAAALKALVEIGHPRFTKDVMWLTSRLSAADQAMVAPSLPAYGNHALPRLKRMLKSRHPQLRVAALRALRRVSTPEAKQLVASAGALDSKTELTAKAPDRAKGQRGGPMLGARYLAPLLREALRLARGGAVAPATKPDAKANTRARQMSRKGA